MWILSNEAHAKKGESQIPIEMWHTPNHKKDFWVQELSLQVIQIVWNRYLNPLFQNIQGQHLVNCYVDIGMHSMVLLGLWCRWFNVLWMYPQCCLIPFWYGWFFHTLGSIRFQPIPFNSRRKEQTTKHIQEKIKLTMVHFNKDGMDNA